MKTGFMNAPDDCQWLRDTALKGIILPTEWAGFQSFVLQGNEDSPHAVNLYLATDPRYTDDYFRVRLAPDVGTHAVCCEYDGETDKPKGGLIPI